ncbi:MAG TPA: patatin-like phospholipase family protein [Burkholderiaceae bacterium]
MPKQPSKTRAGKRKPVIGIALAGGGPLAAMYEIGALTALAEAVDGLDLNAADTYIGISAGGIVAAGLANGITPQEMCRLFIENDPASSTAFFKPEMLLSPAFAEFRKRATAVPGLLGRAAWHYARKTVTRSGSGMLHSFERLSEALPTGIFSGKPLERFIAATFAGAGRTNDFRKLAHKLHIIATDLDSGKSVVFGQPGWDDVPISVAAQASSAVPGLFAPVEIKGHHFVDGALRKTLHASIALEDGVDLLLCLNPIVPYNAKARHGAGKLAGGGLVDVLSQTIRAVLHSRVEIGMAGYKLAYPDVDIVLFEPSDDDAEMFFSNIFSYTNRRRMCESAYQNTRAMLWARRAELGPMLAKHGMRLKVGMLRDATLTLVDAEPAKQGSTCSDLRSTLDQLEHYLKVANG